MDDEELLSSLEALKEQYLTAAKVYKIVIEDDAFAEEDKKTKAMLLNRAHGVQTSINLVERILSEGI